MKQKTHQYQVSVEWDGNLGKGTSGYTQYSRNHIIKSPGKPTLRGSSAPEFRGESSLYNPEDMLVAAISACHMLWFLHLCADEGITVWSYTDEALGTMVEGGNGAGRFVEVLLKPRVEVMDPNMVLATEQLHHRAQNLCFIANSVSFPIRFEAVCVVATIQP